MAITLREQLKHSLSGDQGLGMAWHVRFSVETGVLHQPSPSLWDGVRQRGVPMMQRAGGIM